MRKSLIILMLIVGTSACFAQGGSNYSMYGIGDIHDNLSARFESMGVAGVAVPSEYAINLSNPAMWTFLKTTRVQGGYNYTVHNASRDNNPLYTQNSLTQSAAGVSQVLMNFGIDTARGIDFNVGFYPYSNVNYYLRRDLTVSDDGTDYYSKTYYTGSGGVTEAYAGLSWKPFNFLRIGARANGYFGKVSAEVRTLFGDSQNQEQVNDRKDEVSGYSYTFGLCFEPLKNLLVGAYYEPIADFRTRLVISYDGQLNSVKNDTSYSQKYGLDYPDRMGVGVSYTTGKFIIAADWTHQDFKNFRLEGDSPAKYRAYETYGIGVSRIGSHSYRAGFWDKATYNLGCGYRQQYYSVFGTDINEMYASAGMDVRLIGNFMLNTAVTYGIRGKKTENLVREQFIRLNVNVSLGESWFNPFKPDYLDD